MIWSYSFSFYFWRGLNANNFNQVIDVRDFKEKTRTRRNGTLQNDVPFISFSSVSIKAKVVSKFKTSNATRQ